MRLLKSFLTTTVILLPLLSAADEPYRFAYPCISGSKCAVEKIDSQLRTEFGCDLSSMELLTEKETIFRSRKCLLIHKNAKNTPCPSGTEAKNFKSLKNAKICIRVPGSAPQNKSSAQ